MHPGDQSFTECGPRARRRCSVHSRQVSIVDRRTPSRPLGGPAAAPLESLHLLPLAAVLDAHVVAHRVGVREVARARGDRAERRVARVMRRQVTPRRARPFQPRAAQRALHLALFCPLKRVARPTTRSRVCQHAHICNADTTMLLLRSAAGKPDRGLDVRALLFRNKLSKNIMFAYIDRRSRIPFAFRWHFSILLQSSSGPECGRGSPPGAERGRDVRWQRSLGVSPSLRVLPLADSVRLQLMVDQVVFGFALLAAVLAREPLVTVGLRVHIEHMLAQVGGGGVDAAAERTLRPVAQRRPARKSRPCNTEAAVRQSRKLGAIVSVFIGRGRRVAPPLLHAVYRVHVYLHILASLESLPADGT